MKKVNYYGYSIRLFFAILFLAFSIQNTHSQTLCTKSDTDRYAGTQDGYRYELWNQNAQGTACMTLDSGALFSGEWNGVLNYLARRGLGYDQTQEHQDYGWFYSTYNCNYNPSSATGNSYLSIYGWTVEPLIEYYIIEDWRNWIPSMDAGATPKGTITVNGATYDIWENTRENQPSIFGTATFQQYFSIRRSKRNSGTINISDHFNKWESLGMDLGKLYEVSFVVEGYQSSGSFEFTNLDVFVTDEPLVGIPAYSSTELCNIYPNPAHDFIKVKSYEPVQLEIYSILGELMIKKQATFPDDQIPVNSLTDGSYLMKLKSNDKVISRILIIE